MRMPRIIEVIVGLVFVGAAALKAADLTAFAVQIRYYGILEQSLWIRTAAISTVGLETFLGIMLITGMRLHGLSYASTMVLLAGFSALVTYSWLFRDLKECGCFGEVLPMGPETTLAKNLAMALLIIWAWRVAARDGFEEPPGGSQRRELARSGAALLCFTGVGCTVAFAGNGAFFHPPVVNAARPFEGIEVPGEPGASLNLESGEYLLAMLTATCDECQAAVEVLNELARYGEAPPIVGLVLGGPSDLEELRQLTAPEFPLAPMEVFSFFNLIGKVPPRFYLVREGIVLGFLDDLEPTPEKLTEFIAHTTEGSGDGQA